MKISRILLVISIFLLGISSAKEPTNWMFGAGVGTGYAKVDKKYTDAAGSQLGLSWAKWEPYYSSSINGWGVAWEVLAGYKHWVNDYVGFRYYVNIGAQHYKETIYSAGDSNGTALDYTGNVDVLFNFYNSDSFTTGMFVGIGVGGTSFFSKALDTYESLFKEKVYQWTDPSYAGEGNTYRHHLNATINLGLRFNMFQKVRDIKNRTCEDNGSDRKVCKVPISKYEHSIELVGRFPLIPYKVTDSADTLGTYSTGQVFPGTYGKYVTIGHRPGYTVTNPYKFTVRYIFAF